MTAESRSAVPEHATLGPRPTDEELDLFGMTHPGKVRPDNQDQFLVCTVHPQVLVRWTSLNDLDTLPMRGQRLATLMLVADGVGGLAGGADASRVATQTVTRYVSSALRCYHAAAGSVDEHEFLDELRRAALEAHEVVRADRARRVGGQGGATTLTLGLVIWPWLYVLQVGDSRCYVFGDGRLRQVSRDQTVAQDLVDQGVLSPAQASASPLSNVLSSAIGADEAMPVVTHVDVRKRGTVILVCSDGLTKHVTDDEIAAHLNAMTSAEHACRTLVELALHRGGTDNVTVVVGRALESRR